MKVEKFPKILFQGKELLWDLRQKVTKPQVVIRKNLEADTEKQLLALAPGAIREGKDFSSWGEFLAETLGRPSEQLKIIGIVGTNGKTTTNALMRYLLVAEGKKVLEVGTLGALLWGGKNNESPLWEEKTGFTSPEVHTLQDLLKQSVAEKVDYVVMEVTSHAIALGRVDGIEFDAAAFLNFSQDHLDFHKTLEEYKRVKKSFFIEHLENQKKKKAYVVINVNDKAGAELSQELKAPHDKLKRGDGYVVDENSLELTITLGQREHYPFVGDFQAENLLAAAHAVAALLKKTPVEMMTILKKFPGIPGRMEVLHLHFGGKRRNFIVDYAHKPLALEKNLQTLKKGMKKGRLWVLFGCGGDRDQSKRPLMGKIAGENADVVVVTSDNPRSEDPQKIIDQIVEPLQESGIRYHAMASRKEAMAFCMEKMQEFDICLVAGRGHEEFQIVGDEKIPFLDSSVLKSLSC